MFEVCFKQIKLFCVISVFYLFILQLKKLNGHPPSNFCQGLYNNYTGLGVLRICFTQMCCHFTISNHGLWHFYILEMCTNVPMSCFLAKLGLCGFSQDFFWRSAQTLHAPVSTQKEKMGVSIRQIAGQRSRWYINLCVAPWRVGTG